VRIKLDENLPSSLVARLQGLGHDVDTVPAEKLAGRADPEIWRATQKAERILITQDLDFSDIRQFRPGLHHGLILVRLRVPGRVALARRIEEIFNSEDVTSWTRCFVVVSDLKVRVRRPAE
jgi:predicted nuclease of predicted toxin-antitoxin system